MIHPAEEESVRHIRTVFITMIWITVLLFIGYSMRPNDILTAQSTIIYQYEDGTIVEQNIEGIVDDIIADYWCKASEGEGVWPAVCE